MCLQTFERMLAERIYHLTESKGLISEYQAGYRKMRGCEDQLARIVQGIEDGFEQKPHHRSVLVILDFSKAFDTVWRENFCSTYTKWEFLCSISDGSTSS